MPKFWIVKPGWGGVLQGLLMPVPASVLLLILLARAAPQAPAPFAHWQEAVSTAVLFAPVWETMLLWVGVMWMQERWGLRWRTAFVGALPLILLHFTNSWQNVIGTVPFFTWSAWYLMHRRAAADPDAMIYLRLMLMHAIWNTIVIAIWMTNH